MYYLLLGEHIDGLVHERRNSIANALELRLYCTNPSIWDMNIKITYPAKVCDNTIAQPWICYGSSISIQFSITR